MPAAFLYNHFMNKQELRKFAKEIRAGLNTDLISAQIADKIRKIPEFVRAKHILLYYPIGNELNLLSLCNTEGKKFYLPRVNGENLEICPYECGCKMETSSLHIPEPCANSIDAGMIDFAIIPCLMADKRGYRLGYGGGFYDRFLLSVKCFTVAPVPAELFVDELPTDEFDVKVDLVITD